MPDQSDDQLQKLVSRLDQLERILQSQVQRIHALEVSISLKPSNVPEPPPIPVQQRLENLQEVIPESPRMKQSSMTQADITASEVSPGSVMPEESLESKIGGNLLNKIGM